MARQPRTPRRPPLRVALTGGIASGKSTVSGLFGVLGVPVIDTDLIARDVVAPGTPGLDAVVARFGPQCLDSQGRLDRARMRTLIFSDDTARQDLGALLHPLIRAEATARSRVAGGVYQLIVVPLLVETGTAKSYDRVLVVDCDPQLQRTRLQLRDGASPEQVEALLAAQATREARLEHADDVLSNTADLPALARGVAKLHAQYLHLAEEPTRHTN